MMWGQPFKSKQLAAVEMRGGTCGLIRLNAIHLTTFYIYISCTRGSITATHMHVVA
jgi:hypothetical protein